MGLVVGTFVGGGVGSGWQPNAPPSHSQDGSCLQSLALVFTAQSFVGPVGGVGPGPGGGGGGDVTITAQFPLVHSHPVVEEHSLFFLPPQAWRLRCSSLP